MQENKQGQRPRGSNEGWIITGLRSLASRELFAHEGGTRRGMV